MENAWIVWKVSMSRKMLDTFSFTLYVHTKMKHEPIECDLY